MIQRIQSLYLLLAAGAGVGVLCSNLWKATLSAAEQPIFVSATNNYLMYVLYIIIILIAFASIFLYKKRQLQFRLTVIDILLTLGGIAYQYYLVSKEANALVSSGKTIQSASYLPASFLPIVMVVLLFLAAKGIRKDEKLIKSLDRLR
ncbi:uncharacterized protein DUF4293 [Chitinophaga dinghuensis]|uniref:Uncharacterized protein DUF4293 n=1 Tax=Chitinophaga dinghuensis TaxID=1539050 RepID=A0A327W7C9_9BACT|nr:DUF4293 domain-containing protein [Chitinophaga dinghuensis]RAJ85930.1 uncharacterized protein DUF4293 [Chitinophaga dinghuensis]